jgi:hypothetical protein
MRHPHAQIEEIQRDFCRQRGVEYFPVSANSKLGFALATRGQLPINGLRHSPAGETCGWYIWCGEVFGDTPDFFAPLHTRHFYEDHPEIAKLLGLAPGHRFLLAGDQLQVWFDASLLNV